MNDRTKKEQKKLLLQDTFREREMLSIKNIMELLSCSRKSAYNYLDELKLDGFLLETRTVHNQTLYSIKKSAPKQHELLSYQPLTNDILRKYSIIQELQNGPITPGELRRKFCIPETDFSENTGFKKTTFYRLLQQLVDSDDVILSSCGDDTSGKSGKNTKNVKKYYQTGIRIPAILSLEKEELLELHEQLADISTASPCYQQLHSIYLKMEQILGNPHENGSDTPFANHSSADHYLLYGRQYQSFSRIRQKLSELYQYDYPHRLLNITQKTRKGNSMTFLFATGMVVCSLEKDALYLLGKSSGTGREYPCSIINMDRIESITCTEEPNPCYYSAYFQSVFDTMFSISAEAPVDVEVKFRCVGTVEQKVIQLNRQRKNSSIEYTPDGSLIYKDRISGLPDFANYLRQFGQYAEVLQPEKLKKRMDYYNSL